MGLQWVIFIYIGITKQLLEVSKAKEDLFDYSLIKLLALRNSVSNMSMFPSAQFSKSVLFLSSNNFFL